MSRSRISVCLLVATLVASLVPVHAQTRTVPEVIALGGNTRVVGRSGPVAELGSLLEATEVVVAGTLGDPRSYLSDDQRSVFTDYTLLNPVIYYDSMSGVTGEARSASLSVTQLGGTVTVNGVKYQERHDMLWPLEAGKRVLLLLSRRDGKLWLVGDYCGVFDIGSGRLTPLVRREGFAPEIAGRTADAAAGAILAHFQSRGRLVR